MSASSTNALASSRWSLSGSFGTVKPCQLDWTEPSAVALQVFHPCSLQKSERKAYLVSLSKPVLFMSDAFSSCILQARTRLYNCTALHLHKLRVFGDCWPNNSKSVIVNGCSPHMVAYSCCHVKSSCGAVKQQLRRLCTCTAS